MNKTNLTDPATPTCCGVPCATAYCPHCGDKMREPSALRKVWKYLDGRQLAATKSGNNALASEFADWCFAVKKSLDAETRAKAGGGA